MNIRDTDKSVLSLLRKLTHKLSRRLYFPHNQILIFSSDLARADISEGLDAFLRDYESRMNIYILVSRGKASEILEEEEVLEKTPAIHIARIMENQESSSETVVVTLRDFAIAMLSGSMAPVAPMIELYEEDGKKKAKIEGTAIFKRGKMVGEFDKAQTRGIMLLTGKAEAGVMTVGTQWGDVVLEFMHTQSRLTPVLSEDGSIRMALELNIDGYIESNETYVDMSKPDKVEMLKKLATETIRADIGNSLAKARSLGADVYGFGEAIRRDYPQEWEKLKNSWNQAFAGIELDVNVEIELRSTGGMVKPVVPGGAEQ